MPAYNAADTIEAALACCGRQSMRNLEIILIDDQSSDDTVARAAATCREWTLPLSVEHSFHSGVPGKLRNRGLTLARGRFIQFLDADDIITVDKLRLQTAEIDASQGEEPAAAYCDYRFFAENATRCTIERRGPPDGMHWPDDIERQFEMYTVIHRFLFSRFLLERVDGFDESLSHAEDLDLWLRLLIDGARFVYNDRPMAYYRERTGHSLRHPEDEARCRLVVGEKLRDRLSGSSLGETKAAALDAIVERERLKLDRLHQASAVREAPAWPQWG